MNKAIWGVLSDSDRELYRMTERASLAELSEDDLADLHDRVRRARNKYSKLYRRRASQQVSDDAARGKASAKHSSTSAKAEAFEEALARVSDSLARAARHSARELRDERIAAARSERRPRSRDARGARRSDSESVDQRRSGKRRTPASERTRASNKAQNKRNQARRDTTR